MSISLPKRKVMEGTTAHYISRCSWATISNYNIVQCLSAAIIPDVELWNHAVNRKHHMGCVLVYLCCCNKIAQDAKSRKNINLYLTILESGCPGSKDQQALCLWDLPGLCFYSFSICFLEKGNTVFAYSRKNKRVFFLRVNSCHTHKV